jgi:putative ABC transport system permease protein
MVAGVLAALMVTQLLSQFLFEIRPTDPFTFVSVVLLLAVAIVLASYLPARRASAIDPQVVLREM